MLLTVFLLEFSSWHWNGDFTDARLRAAWADLSPPTTAEAFERAFLTLLRSGDTVAACVALDYFDRAEMTERYVGGNVLEHHADEVFAVARRTLAGPPRPADERAFEGANHASALGALTRGGLEDQDAPAIAAILERMPEETLRYEAVKAAELLMDGTPNSRLAELVARSEACARRVGDIAALRDDPGPEATTALLRATEDDEWRVAHEAAAALATGERFYTHRPFLERLAATWPPHHRSSAADLVRAALAPAPHSTHWAGYEPETPALVAAHREIRSPTGARAHREAFRALLDSGHPVATGIALDHFHEVEGLIRFGLDDGEEVPKVLAAARAILARPPSDDPVDEASRASALDIIQELGRPEDAPALTAALCPDVPPKVLECAVNAASWCLDRWRNTSPAPVAAALERLLADPGVPEEVRRVAAEALDTPGHRQSSDPRADQ